MIFNKKAEIPEDTEVEPMVDEENRIVYFRGGIHEASALYLIAAIHNLEKKSNKPISIHFSSGGGNVYEGLAIYDTIRASPCEIRIYASGSVMSMGFVIFLAGDVRMASPNTTFMMHSIRYQLPDTMVAREHETHAIEGKRMNNILMKIIHERTKRPKSYWYRILQSAGDRYFDVSEAKDVGIIKSPEKKKRGKKNDV